VDNVGVCSRRQPCCNMKCRGMPGSNPLEVCQGGSACCMSSTVGRVVLMSAASSFHSGSLAITMLLCSYGENLR